MPTALAKEIAARITDAAEMAVEAPSNKVAENPLNEVSELLGRYAYLERSITAAKEQLKPKEVELADIKARLQAWAEKHKTVFEGKKSFGVGGNATIGYKAGPRKVSLPLDLNTAWYLHIVETELPTAVEKRVDPKLLISGLDHKPDLAKMLRKRGVQVVQEDYFYVAIKKS